MDNKNSNLFDRSKIPGAFIFRRLHSLTGAWLVIYLFYHLLVNSQAGLFFKDEGHHFIRMVNSLENMPFLSTVEILFIGLPLLVHGIWGVIYLRTAKMNSFPSEKIKPVLPEYRKNRAYSWQRITSWLLLVGIVLHVVHMRFVSSPEELSESHYVVKVQDTPQTEEAARIMHMRTEKEGNKLLAYSDEPGAGFLLMVRNSFHNPYMAIAYSLLVWFAAYHACNGLWTFLISWGITMTARSQKYAKVFTTFLMLILIFFGLFAIWGTYATTATS